MIQEVVRQGLCTQCGFCAALCPRRAITMIVDRRGNQFPRVDDGLCNDCRLCLDICSGREFVFEAHRRPAEKDSFFSTDIGDYRALWTGFAADEGLRRRCASGGLTTAVAVALLEKSLADRVVVTRGSSHGAFQGEAVLAARAGEVAAGRGSWYLPVSHEDVVRETIGGDFSLAVVGLPCHIQAWRKAAAGRPGLEKRVSLYLGLFCDHLVDRGFHRLFLECFDIDHSHVKSIAFRGGGWPGKISIEFSNGHRKVIPYGHPLRKLLWKTYLFTPRRCLFCYDALAEFADISLGDAWLPEYAGDSRGRNALIVRSRRGEDVIGALYDEGKIVLESLDPDRLEISQNVQLYMKKKEIGSRLALARALRRGVPQWGEPLPAATLKGFVIGAASLTASGLSRRLWFERILRILPWRTLARLYGRLFRKRGKG